MLIRPAVPEDAAARAALAAVCHPHVLVSERMIRYFLPDPALRRASVVAEVDGRVVGSGSVELEVMDRTTAAETISVAVDARRRGVGSAIHAALAEHLATLPATRLKGRVTGPEGRAFAEAHGFTPGRVWRISGTDPRQAPPVPRIPEGITLTPLAAVEDLAPVYELYRECGADMPGRERGPGFSYEDWLKFAVNSPVADRDCSIVAYDGDVPVALTFINSDGDRAFNSLAGTARDHRGKGLGRLVKAVSLHKVAAKGVMSVYTANTEDNAAMLAVNTWLGYRPALEELTMVRPVG
ncbi:GNAT family N-acetyltransferase [Phytomonospora endophytica]|uniref:GNAT superfamily N-acetyltransferase n=1 Tax=Phytomonospora endophytica TaxID=714109 RepID=A0A841G1F5_9ACTN|nr:GNAT family N-acetyltransferase [Phytomonospora endophytica]MBB6039487.1 GNAT superfamily N-acetyltransferase [Phytomonospora endophytica]